MPNRTLVAVVSLLSRGFLLLALVCIPGTALAQGTSATVSGYITDPTGAKIPSATVTFTNTTTGVASRATSNGDGLYRAGLAAGTYSATVTMQGFKTSVQQGIFFFID